MAALGVGSYFHAWSVAATSSTEKRPWTGCMLCRPAHDKQILRAEPRDLAGSASGLGKYYKIEFTRDHG